MINFSISSKALLSLKPMEHRIVVGMPWTGATRLYETRYGQKIEIGDSLLLQHGEENYMKKVIDIKRFDSIAQVQKYLNEIEPLSREITWNFKEIYARYLSQVDEKGILIIVLN